MAFQIEAADAVEDDINPGPAGVFERPRREVFLSMVEGRVSAELETAGAPLRRTGRHQDPSAGRFCELDGRGADTAAPPVDQGRIAGVETAGQKQVEEGGDENLGNGGRLGIRQPVRYVHHTD